MKYIKLGLDDAVLAVLEEEAGKLGVKTNAYIQMVLGLHVKENKSEYRSEV